jgi:hypothetical protein
MLTKSEIALLTVTVLGTLAVWLAMERPSLVSPIYGELSIACSAATIALRGVRPTFGRRESIVRSSVADGPHVSVTGGDD